MGEKAYVLSPMFSPRASAVASGVFQKVRYFAVQPSRPVRGATLWRVHRRRTGEVIRHSLVLPTVFALLPMGVIRHAHPLTRKYVYIIQYLMNIAKLIAYFNYICHAPRFLFVPAVV